MESKEKVELIQLAIQQLMEEQRDTKLISTSDESQIVGDGDDRHLLLARLFSQLEALKGDGELEPLADPKELPSPAIGGAKNDTANEAAESGGAGDVGREERIIRELRHVKKQNFITHCLLSVMIVLTVAWQISEVSLVLKLQDGLSNPFRSFGNMVKGMIKRPSNPPLNVQNGEKQSDTKQQQIESYSIPPLKIPELPRLDLTLGLDSDEK